MKRRLIIAGLGNIGSHAAWLAASLLISRADEEWELLLADPDAFTEKNLTAQRMSPADIGANKAIATASALASAYPKLAITAHPHRVEELPLGFMLDAVVFGCLDSRAARVALNRMTGRAGAPLFDAGVSADGRLARLSLFHVHQDSACLECGWGQPEYDALEVTYACVADAAAPSTGAPSALGALAASLQVLEFERFLSEADASESRETVLAAVAGQFWKSRLRRDSGCRFHHQRIESDALTTIDFADSSLRALIDDSEGSLQIEGGARWITRTECGDCRQTNDTLVVTRGTRPPVLPPCSKCGGTYFARPFDIFDTLPIAAVRDDLLSAPLHTFGIQDRDIVTVFPSGSYKSSQTLLLKP